MVKIRSDLSIFNSIMLKTPMITLLARLNHVSRIVPVSLGLLTLGLSPVAAIAGSAAWNQFDVCVTEIANHGVARNTAASACSDALIPKELSQCVTMIRRATPIDGDNALGACYQVRRPIDLGNCVADVYNAIPSLSSVSSEDELTTSENIPLLTLLNSCRASLRPGYYSECVIAVNRDVPDMTPVKALNKCLSAEDFPRDLFPAYETR